jgi:hypothetical protein
MSLMGKGMVAVDTIAGMVVIEKTDEKKRM